MKLLNERMDITVIAMGGVMRFQNSLHTRVIGGEIMATCSMCRKSVDSMEDCLLELEDKPICPECAKKINDLLVSEDKRTVQNAVNYVYTCMKQAADPEVADCLKEILDNNASAVEDIDEAERKRKSKQPVVFDEKADYYADKRRAEEAGRSAPGISALFSAFAWIAWIGGLITAIAIALLQRDNGFVWFFVIFSVYLFSGSVCMAVSSIIKYLSRIADNTDPTRKQSQP